MLTGALKSASLLGGAAPHHAEGLVNPKVRAQKKVTDFGYPRACGIRKHQI
jgi:hypothetical protein